MTDYHIFLRYAGSSDLSVWGISIIFSSYDRAFISALALVAITVLTYPNCILLPSFVFYMRCSTFSYCKARTV